MSLYVAVSARKGYSMRHDGWPIFLLLVIALIAITAWFALGTRLIR